MKKRRKRFPLGMPKDILANISDDILLVGTKYAPHNIQLCNYLVTKCYLAIKSGKFMTTINK